MSDQTKSGFQTAVAGGVIDREDILTVGMPPFFILPWGVPVYRLSQRPA